MREFFGFGGYQREPEGYLSWQHLLFVTTLMVIMVALAAFLRADQWQIFTGVGGVYGRDPRRDPGAVRFGRIGYEEMRRLIETSATPAKKAGLWSSRWHITNMEGRIETGHMLRSVTDVHTRFTGAWGWALNGGVAEPYFTYQNYGFRHNITGKQIPGMNALLGSFLKAREQLIRDLDELVK